MTTTQTAWTLRWQGPTGQVSRYLHVELETGVEYVVPDLDVARAMVRSPDWVAVTELPPADDTDTQDEE